MMREMSVGVADMRSKAKIIKVSSARQVTIPIKFYKQVGISDEAECFVRDDEIVIRPVRQDTEFAEQILRDLIEQGYSGEELISKFKELRAAIRPAARRMLEEADEAAQRIDTETPAQQKVHDLFHPEAED